MINRSGKLTSIGRGSNDSNLRAYHRRKAGHAFRCVEKAALYIRPKAVVISIDEARERLKASLAAKKRNRFADALFADQA